MLSRACTPTAGSDSSERSSRAPLPMNVGQAGMPGVLAQGPQGGGRAARG